MPFALLAVITSTVDSSTPPLLSLATPSRCLPPTLRLKGTNHLGREEASQRQGLSRRPLRAGGIVHGGNQTESKQTCP